MLHRQPPSHITLGHYRYVVDLIDEMVFALEMDGNVSYLNASAEKRLGVKTENAVGRPLIDWLSPEGMGEVLEGIESVVSRREPFTVPEAILKNADSSPLEMRLHLAPFYDSDDCMSHILGIGFDLSSDSNVNAILADKQAETRKALQRSERFLTESIGHMNRRNRFLEALLSMSKEFGAETSPQNMIAIFEREFPRHFHYPTYQFRMILNGEAESFDPHPIFAEVIQQEQTRILKDLNAIPDYHRLDNRNQSAALIVIAMHSASFGVLQVESPGLNQFPDEEVALLEVFARQLAMGLANQRLFEEASALRRYQQSIVDSAGSGIFILDEAANTLSVNSMAVSVSGKERDSLIGRPIQEALGRDSNATSIQKLMESIAVGQPITNLEFTLKTRNPDSVRHLLADLKPFHPEDSLARYLLTVHDFTRLRQMEVQMVQSEKLATLGQMAAGLGHELSNPITFIKSYNELMISHGGLEAGQLGRAQKIHDAIERIEELIHNLLAYTRPSDPSERYPVDINEVIEQLLSFTEYQIRKRGVEIFKRFQTDLPKVMANKGLLQQMFINIIENGLQAVPSKGGRLEIQTEVTDRTNVLIRIHDNGSGIQKEFLGQIFNPFFTTKPEGEGTGLGLSIVQQIISHHDGRVSVTSDPKEGTQFRIVLPACR